ncbi:MAG TPA: thiamine diphosphokinase [Acidimicrobiia bacterium]|nr:thiamine diphosphokinase [Acidimicrobiia bacterium]
METILIFAGGDRPRPDLSQELPVPDLVVAADGGYEIAVGLGYRVDVVVGDMDSITTTPLPDHVVVERHPADKDQTDLDLAFELAIREDPARVVIVGGTGGRHDHEMATAGLIGSTRWENIEEIDWVSSRSRSHVVRGRRMVHGDVGATVTLLPLGGGVAGITTRGLQWELNDADLEPGSTHGVSNVMRTPVAEISTSSGCLLVVFPGDG